MPSSTSRHASFNPWLLALLFAGIAGAPVLWLTALQTGYVLAYQACDTRSKSWVTVPTFAAIALLAGLSLVAWLAHRRAASDRLPLPALGWVSVGIAVLMVIVMIASAIAPVVLQACD